MGFAEDINGTPEAFSYYYDTDIKLITSAGPDISSSKYTNAWSWIREKSKNKSSFTYAVDEHDYNTKEWLFERNDFYDSYSRSAPVYIGEYAAKLMKFL